MFKYISNYIRIQWPEDLDALAEYGFNVGMVSLTVLFCFINAFGYLITMHFIKYYDVENKYPKYKKIISYFNKTTMFFLIVEIVIGFSGLIGLVYIGFLPLFG